MFRIDSVGVDYCFSSYRLIQWIVRSLVIHECYVDVTSVTIVRPI